MDTLTRMDIQYVRDTIKEAIEADTLEQVRDELIECLELLEAAL